VLPEIRYARRGDIHVAYQVLGDGETDLVLVSEWFFHLEGRPDIPSVDRFFRRLSSFSRLIFFDKYGIGLSNPLLRGRATASQGVVVHPSIPTKAAYDGLV
jgi:hypothetical protein